MVQIEGKYQNDRNENLDEYYKAVGMPYVPRKMVANSHPSLEITKDNEEFCITTSTLFRTVVLKFKLGEEYEEDMPGGKIKTVTTMEDNNKLVSKSMGPGNVTFKKEYEFFDDQCVLVLTHEKSGQTAKRYFKRI